VSNEYRKLARVELDEIAGEPLPERAAMSLIASGVVAPGVAVIGTHLPPPPPPDIQGEDM